ncbi:hypothetical protein HN588_10500 [Candidatus Bathyarchaeota archaeon]|jgi:hypothetical protein|nr:hypothetical protein [Candidatus Bathyarchaeota archaeon]
MSDAPTTDNVLRDEDKRAILAEALATVIRMTKELPVEVDPYAGVDIPDPIDATIDVTNHPAIHKALESLNAAEAEIGLANAVLGVVKEIGGKYGLVIGV